MVNQEFVTAGNAIFTVEVPPSFQAEHDTKPHYTFRVKLKKGNPDGQWKYDTYFVNLLTGPDNMSDYSPLGKLEWERKDGVLTYTGGVRLTSNTTFTDQSWPVRIIRRVLPRLFKGEQAVIEAAGWQVHHVGRCCRCGRPLTVPESIESGIGPECAGKMGR